MAVQHAAMRAPALALLLVSLVAAAAGGGGGSSAAFQPFAAHCNTIHVATADFDGVGAKDYVINPN